MVPSALAAEPAANTAPELLETFGYGEVSFEPGVHETQLLETQAVLMSLGMDELLKPYRVRAGQPAPGANLGGWYDADAFCPGHTYGQWLSALSRSYAISGDASTKAKIRSMVQGLRQVKDLDVFFKGNGFGNRFPAYIFDKLNCGLSDAYTFGDCHEAADTLDYVLRSAQPSLPGKALTRPEQAARPHKDVSYTWDESYTLGENLFLAWQRTGDKRYREMAVAYLYDEFFKPLAAGDNVLPGNHAYSHLNSMNSAAMAYIVLKDPTYLKAAVNGFNFVQQQSYATGGWGPQEAFVTPGKGELATSLTKTHASFETPCGAYGEFKLTRYLLRITGDASYGDAMETVMYNTILGAKPLQTSGQAFYYSDYNPEGQKVYHPDKWPCCSGTITQIAADYRISTYLRDSDGVYVNLYIPSTLKWKHAGHEVLLRQTGSYPFDERVSIDVRAAGPARFALRLRIPAWAKGARVTVNGKHVRGVTAGRFAVIDRTWGANDRVELTLPLTTRLEQVDPETPNMVALMHGPLVLFVLGGGLQKLPEKTLLGAEQTAPAEWLVHAPAGDVHLRPFTAIKEEKYSTYVQLV
ncbi:hypothetical protein GCM10011507_23920 [Edaphobacter acidisoli]|uniref:Glycoside hydrolase family 127 protein n=2 Tax=Edaphobacter acidisoli TaxID=2040573 RepID=A0A916RUD2_9BACT|nr:hypothetical protein GCM10011507_23920 [Edaphobacter acidisoli]